MSKVWRIAKWVIPIFVIMLLVVGGAAAFIVPKIGKVMEERAKAAGGKQVVIEVARHDQLVRFVSAPGAVAPLYQANITSRVSAKIEKMPFDEGDHVSADDVLVELESRDLEASLAGAKARYLADIASAKRAQAELAAEEARIAGAKASYDNAVAEYERRQELYSSGDVSQSELDTTRTEMDRNRATYDAQIAGLDSQRASVESAQARADASRADMDRAQRNLEYATITAPFDGVITRRIANIGEVALGTIQNQGATIMTLEDQSQILIKARLAELDAPKVKVGQKARCYVSGFPDEVFDGAVKKVGLMALRWAADNTMYFEAEVVLDTKGLPVSSGTTANVDIEIETLQDVLVVPSQAVLDRRVDSLPQTIRENNPLVDRDKTFVRVVFVMESGKAVMTPVKTITSNLTRTAVSEGLPEGKDVIVGPFSVLQELADKDSVRVRGADEENVTPGEAQTTTVASTDEQSDPKTEKSTTDATTEKADKSEKKTSDGTGVEASSAKTASSVG